ncbi:enoyl-CoA hydratase/isomerase family protein [Paralcaligenes sp. KSB-10]|uniref:enoyl-CoA hydratase/isomerase family protein n=1 Tax=Paralcaligenes sp. KSB-10 TaxID=2901142 RepID=UPI001E356687|nr:enoyl-CoA hydratase/isomerase family protein [Paralcaligenes sp. KSB-10]UHL63960.1 enoyl-CoA hydratase/isomerase family protein [Paralcaligenes sp. KSB-10]
MESNKDILVTDRGGGQIWLTINRAGKHNALSRSVLEELSNTVTRYGDDADTRFIVIQGAGERYFAAGGDLVDLSSVRTPEATRAMSSEARGALDSVRNCKTPVIAYLNGDAIGGGAELALACDMRMISAPARIGFIHARLAITPAWGGGTDLCSLVGASRALRMMSRCEMIHAEMALDWGLADAVITDGPEGQDVREFLQPLLQRSGLILRSLKEQANAWRTGRSYTERRDAEQRHLIASWTHDDHWQAADHILSKGKK